MRNARLDEAQAGIKTAQRNINNLRYADTTLMAKSEEELKSLLMKEAEKAGLKLNIQKTKIMASSTITSWQTDREIMENSDRLLFSWAPKSLQMVTTAIKSRCLLLGRTVMTSLDSILKSRHYFADKGPSSQSYGFPSSHVWMSELDHKEN